MLCMAGILMPGSTVYADRNKGWLSYGSDKNTITKKWDIDGDNKKEEVTMTVYGKTAGRYYKSYRTNGVRVYVDGKYKFAIKNKNGVFNDYYYMDFIKLKNGTRYLCFCGDDSYEDYTYYLYRCKNNGQIKREVVVGAGGKGRNHFAIRNRMKLKRVFGNTLNFEVCDQTAGIGYIKYDVFYCCTDRELKLKDNVYDVVGYNDWSAESFDTFDITDRITARQIKIYSDKECNNMVIYADKGAKIKITRLYIPDGTYYDSENYRMVYYADNLGWFNASDIITNGELFEGSRYAE